jgi:hypothetical protein
VTQEDTELIPVTHEVEEIMKKFKKNEDAWTDFLHGELLKKTGLEFNKYKNFWSKY